MSAASDLCDFDEAMAELENMLGEMQRNLGSSSYRQVLERYLKDFEAPPSVGRPIERAMGRCLHDDPTEPAHDELGGHFLWAIAVGKCASP